MALTLANLNGVRHVLNASILAADTSIVVQDAVAPWAECPDPGTDYYYLTLVDYATRPTAWERVKVTAKTVGTGSSTLAVTRNIDSSTGSAIDFSAGASIQFVVGAEELTEITAKAKYILSAGTASSSTTNYAFRYDCNSATTEYKPFFAMFRTSSDSDGSRSKWFNMTGVTLLAKKLVVYTADNTAVGDQTLELYVNGSPTGMSVTLTAGVSNYWYANTGSISIPDQAYIYLKNTGSAASETGRAYGTMVQLYLEEA